LLFFYYKITSCSENIQNFETLWTNLKEDTPRHIPAKNQLPRCHSFWEDVWRKVDTGRVLGIRNYETFVLFWHLLSVKKDFWKLLFCRRRFSKIKLFLTVVTSCSEIIKNCGTVCSDFKKDHPGKLFKEFLMWTRLGRIWEAMT
jgi:hypothetical protein